MKPSATHVASLAARMGAATLRFATHALASPARETMGDETGRPRPTRPPRYWPNPSSTENGRPWPPAPPHW